MNPGSRWKGRRGFASGEVWVLPNVGRDSGVRTLWHTLPRRQHSGEETGREINIWMREVLETR